MAVVRNNTLTEGISGRVGGLVFKNYGSTTVVTARPRPPKMQSEQQQVNRSKFKEATRWAKAVLLDAARKEYYQNKAKELHLPNAYTAAITDYMRKPKLQLKVQLMQRISTTYEVSKKGFELKWVAVLPHDAAGVRGAMRVVVKDYSGAWVFDVDETESLNGITVMVMDEIGKVHELDKQ